MPRAAVRVGGRRRDDAATLALAAREFQVCYDSCMPPKVIAVAGPYSAPTEAGRRRNLAAMHDAAAEVRRRGHVPLIGVDVALPVADLMRSLGRPVYRSLDEIERAG